MGFTQSGAFSGPEGHGQTGWGATYNWTSVASAATGTRGADGACKAVESIFARSTRRAGGTLRRGRWLEKVCRKAVDHPDSGAEGHRPPCLLLLLAHSHGWAREHFVGGTSGRGVPRAG